MLSVLANIFDVPQTSAWADYTLNSQNRIKEFVLHIFTFTDDKKQKTMDAIKSTSFITNLNEELKKKFGLEPDWNWSKGFSGIGSASDPVTEKIIGTRILLVK